MQLHRKVIKVLAIWAAAQQHGHQWQCLAANAVVVCHMAQAHNAAVSCECMNLAAWGLPAGGPAPALRMLDARCAPARTGKHDSGAQQVNNAAACLLRLYYTFSARSVNVLQKQHAGSELTAPF